MKGLAYFNSQVLSFMLFTLETLIMRSILRILLLFTIFLSLQTWAFANDGAFYASGNQLIPIVETDIQVRKEILSLKKIENEWVEVTVYYEFFNPKKTNKELVVGFEAFSPEGDVDGAPVEGKHPYMKDFKVNLNEKSLPFQVAYVADSNYVKQGIIKSVDLRKFSGSKNGNYVDFFYVYHFKAIFKPGINKLKHTYRYKLSGSIDLNYQFEYILTAANRWANKQIDDFTLILDMGSYETFQINKSFFQNAKEWDLQGRGKHSDVAKSNNPIMESDAVKFHIQEGKLVFKKKNFRPKGELYVYNFNNWGNGNILYPEEGYIAYSIHQQPDLTEKSKYKADEKKILRNLPFARRGHVFQDKLLKDYYENTDWYLANPNYQVDRSKLTNKEKAWLKDLDQ